MKGNEDENGKDIKLDNYDVEFKNVTFGYDSRTGLKDVSFRIPEKTSTAIVGPSGSGKTTVCSLLARFYDPQSGSITMGGHDLKEFTCDSLLSNISMVFQNVYLFCHHKASGSDSRRIGRENCRGRHSRRTRKKKAFISVSPKSAKGRRAGK